MLRFWIISCLLQFTSLIVQGQDADYIQAVRTFNGVDLYSGKMVDIDGKAHLAIPVRTSIDTVPDAWILYDASARKPLIKDTFSFIFDYSISSTLSGILYKKIKDGKQLLFYSTWPGYPGSIATATTISIDFLHQNKFVNDYIGVTEIGNTKPYYLHVSGRRVLLPQIPDNSFLYPFKDENFQVTGIPSGPLLLLVNKQNYTTYASISTQPNNILLVNKNNSCWFLRSLGPRLDSIGPFLAAEEFDNGQSFGVVKDQKGVYGIASLTDFKSYAIPWQAGEEIDTLISLKDTNLFACKYRSPARVWRLYKWNGTGFDTVIRELPVGYTQDIFPVWKATVIVSDPGSPAQLIADITKPNNDISLLKGIVFSSLKAWPHVYDEAVTTKKKVNTLLVMNLISAQQVSDKTLKTIYFIRDGKLLANEADVSLLSYLGERFLLYKKQDTWQWKDVERPATVFPQNVKYKWVTPFVLIGKSSTDFFATALTTGLTDAAFLYINKNGPIPSIKANKSK